MRNLASFAWGSALLLPGVALAQSGATSPLADQQGVSQGVSQDATGEDAQAASPAPFAAPAPSWLGGESLLGAPTAPPTVSNTLPITETAPPMVGAQAAAPGPAPTPSAGTTDPAPATSQMPAPNAPTETSGASVAAQPEPSATPLTPPVGDPEAVAKPIAGPAASPRPPRKTVLTQPGPATRISDAGSRYDFGASTMDPSSQAVVWRQPSSPILTTRGLGLTVGGGVVGFLNSDTADLANTGGAWEARLIYGTRSFLAMEAAYIGSAQSLNLNGLPEDALLVGHGAEGNLRVNFTRVMLIQPYIFGGAGWTSYGLMRTQSNTSALSGSDNVFHLPVGLGVGLRNDGMMFDLRATARVAFDETLMRDVFADRSGDGDLDSWNVSAKLGWEL